MLARAIGTGMVALCLLACTHPAGNTRVVATSLSQEAKPKRAATATQTTSADPAAPVIRITARKWSFTPDEIHLVVGQPVILELVSLDVTHGFNVPDLGVRVDVELGQSIQIPVRPARVGTFDFHCDVFCGNGHEGMSGRIVVTPAL
jgi:cytochrome c oxidase subunit 2